MLVHILAEPPDTRFMDAPMTFGISHVCVNRFHPASSFADIEEVVAQTLCPHRMEVVGEKHVNAELYSMALDRATLLELHYGRATRITAGDIAEHYLFRTTLDGCCVLESGDERIGLSAGALSISSPHCNSTIITDRDCRNLLLRVDRSAMEMRLADMLQKTIREPIRFDLCVARNHPGWEIFRSTLRYLCELSQYKFTSQYAGIFGAEFTQWLLTLLLSELPHSYSDALCHATSAPLPVHVTRARDHIEANLCSALSVRQVAMAIGVSSRTLQNVFVQFLRTSPGAYIRERRLDAIHAALQAHGGRSVTDILLEYGVHSFGHFARLYAHRFGCVPSETMKQRPLGRG